MSWDSRFGFGADSENPSILISGMDPAAILLRTLIHNLRFRINVTTGYSSPLCRANGGAGVKTQIVCYARSILKLDAGNFAFRFVIGDSTRRWRATKYKPTVINRSVTDVRRDPSLGLKGGR